MVTSEVTVIVLSTAGTTLSRLLRVRVPQAELSACFFLSVHSWWGALLDQGMSCHPCADDTVASTSRDTVLWGIFIHLSTGSLISRYSKVNLPFQNFLFLLTFVLS